jgi:N-ethylmaleimide reductase
VSDLFSPVSLGALSLRNHVVMSAMTRSRAGSGDAPTDLHVEYYRQRATAGLIVTEGVQPSPAGKGYCRTPGLYSPAQVAGWAAVADAVHAEGGLIVAQLMHCGRVAAHLNKGDGSEIVAPSPIRGQARIFTDQDGLVDLDMPRALATDEVRATIGDYRQAALNARAAGLDGVELHCSSGYLPMQFLSSNTNQRSDAYGGSAQNRIRFVIETIEALGESIGFDRVGLRICPGFDYNDIHDADPVETYGLLLDQASDLGLAYLHLVARVFPDIDNLALVRERWRGALILNNELTPASAQKILSRGEAQAVSFGRPFIGNPDFVKRVREGLPLADYDPALLYTPGPRGYTDYPAAA